MTAWNLNVPLSSWIGYESAEAIQASDPPPAVVPRESAALLVARADEAMLGGRWADAASLYERAATLEPSLVVAHARLARALAFQSRADEAIEAAQRAVGSDPGSAEAKATLALALDWSGQADRAVIAATEAFALDRQLPMALTALVEAYTDLYRLSEADDVLERAIALAPNDPEVYRVHGNLLETRLDYAGAVASYRRALGLAPTYSYLYVSLGHALRAQRLYDEALIAYRRAAELAPTDARAEGGQGMVYAAREEYGPAILHLRRAIEIDPRYPTAHAQLAWIYYARRDYEQALPLFERAVSLDRDPGRVAQYRHAMGWIHLNGRRTTEARAQFEKALALNPGLKGARDGLEAIRRSR